LLALAATLFASALGSPSTVRADPLTDPAARVQIVIKTIHIIDDHDGFLTGAGDMELEVVLSCYAKPTPCLGKHPGVNLAIYRKKFTANTGETVAFDDLVLPQPNELTDPLYGSTDSGYPLDLGQNYHLALRMQEIDPLDGFVAMGSRTLLLTPENGWGIGTHNLYTVLPDRLGDFEVELEIRRAPLPDIQPIDIKVDDLPDSPRKRVCTVVRNVGAAVAGPFQLALYVDDVEPSVGRPSVPILGAEESAERCVEIPLPPGPHRLRAVVDEPHRLMELNETNNAYERTYPASAARLDADPAAGSDSPPANADANGGFVPPSSPAPDPRPSSARADLAVNAIRVNGQAPDGKSDCKDGKNAVTVVVKNGGAEKAGAFAVRLEADGGDVGEQTVSGLEVGQEREVRFEDVRLKKGEHKLAATVDPKDADAESNGDDNELKVTAGCTAAD
jgi:hypothetical protein